MNRIALAYCREQAELATQLDRKLIRIGIPFEHITDEPGKPYGAFAQQLQQCTEPILLIVTDNLLKSEACLTGLRAVLLELLGKNQLVIAVADGRTSKDGGQHFEPVTTHFDRMVYALQYMNFWQNAWLDMSSRQLHSSDAEEKAMLGPKLEATRNIANEIGELITLLRETGYIEWPELEADAYNAFFRRFGLSQWHEQYKQLASYEVAPIEPTEKAEPVLAVPSVSGLLTPTPIEPPQPEPEFSEMNSLIDEMADEEPFEIPVSATPPLETQEIAPLNIEPEAAAEEGGYSESEIQQTIRDAWFWLEKGHLERGMELLSLAQEQHPDNEALKTAFADAQQQFNAVPEAPLAAPVQTTQTPAPATPNDHTANETHSYDLMGDMASEKGDYLFAKYCWDRVVEINPNFPNIYRKLGLMTSEHLRDYKETGILYLQKALEQNPNDAEVLLAFADQAAQKEDKAQAEACYLKAVEIDPTLRTRERDEQFLQPVYAPIVTAPATTEAEAPAQVEPQIIHRPTPKPKEILTVMITGASSGIGRATAEIFAANGHRLILTGRRVERLSALKAQLQQDFQSDVLMLPFDVRDQPTVQATIDHLPEDWQNIDVLINNAGGAKGLSPIHEGDLDHWETMIDTNLKGLLYVTRAVSPGMVQRRRGHIINLSSSAGKEVYANGNVYCATKFAVEALSRAMRLDLHKFNIRVSQVSPGHVEETEFALNRFDGDAEKAKIYNDFQPLKASDVAETIYFIATRPPHVNIQDIWLFGTQQASATVIDRSGR